MRRKNGIRVARLTRLRTKGIRALRARRHQCPVRARAWDANDPLASHAGQRRAALALVGGTEIEGRSMDPFPPKRLAAPFAQVGQRQNVPGLCRGLARRDRHASRAQRLDACGGWGAHTPPLCWLVGGRLPGVPQPRSQIGRMRALGRMRAIRPFWGFRKMGRAGATWWTMRPMRPLACRCACLHGHWVIGAVRSPGHCSFQLGPHAPVLPRRLQARGRSMHPDRLLLRTQTGSCD